MLNIFFATFKRDLVLGWRSRGDLIVALLFFVVVVCLFPFGVGAEPNLLRKIAPGVVWVAALLSTLLSLSRLFTQDYLDGTLEQMVLSAEPPVLWVLGKIAAYWLTTALPLVFVTPGLALLFDLGREEGMMLCAALFVGTPILSLLGAVGAALTLSARGGGSLLALLVLPLFVPVLIFGVGAVEASIGGTQPRTYLLLLSAGTLGALAIMPWACVAALRIAHD